MQKSIIPEEEETFSEECFKLIDYYYGENFEKLADEQDDLIKRSPWQFDFEWFELLEKYNALRMLFNDRRRKRSKTLRWLRKKLREELLKEGRKVHIRKSHMARYPKRKIKRRQEDLENLKKMYGDDYNIYWDMHHPCRRFADRKFRYETEGTGSIFLGELSEPDVEEDEALESLTEGKVMSSLELITQMGVENVPEEIFTADLDATLITLESRSSLGVKIIPSLSNKSRKESVVYLKTSAFEHENKLAAEEKLLTAGYESPQDDSDVSIMIDKTEDESTIIDIEMQELDYIQQSPSPRIQTLQTKKVASVQKREISEGILIKQEESISDEEDLDDVEKIIKDDDYEEEEDIENKDAEERESKQDSEQPSEILPDGEENLDANTKDDVKES